MNDKPTILVVDDNQDLLEYIRHDSKAARFSVQTAVNGVSAVDKFKDQNFDVTLMDIVMPEMNGVDAFKKIKEIQPGSIGYFDDRLLR